MKSNIVIHDARQNNLKNVSVQIPKNQLTIVTGLSGSGKSSLVFDTLAAESSRELNDTFPSFVQQYLPRYGRPAVTSIDNMPVSIIVDQKKLSSNARSTIGTYTDIYTFLRLLYSRIGSPFIGYSDSFSFNRPEGSCPSCDGLGQATTIDVHTLIDFDKSLNESPIDYPTFQKDAWRWKRYAYSGLFDLDKKIKDYDDEELDQLLNSPQRKLENPTEQWPPTALYEGIIPRFKRSILSRDEAQRHKQQLDKFVVVEDCPECHGTRVNAAVRSCMINGKSIADVVDMPIDEVIQYLKTIKDELAEDVIEELIKRLTALEDIGLSYLSLGRSTTTLSGGEAQRIKIAKYLNSSLADVMYILDEPSAGLHPHDITRLKKALLSLRDNENTVILVEHNPLLIESADYIIDMGPRAGQHGGEVQYQGDYPGFLRTDTLSSKQLQATVPLNGTPRTPEGTLEIRHSVLHNLKDVSVDVPLGIFTVICGVAGSGKSSLASAIISKAKREDMNLVHISQKNIGLNLRSIPLTYLNIFDKIRKLFADASGQNASLFSYNSAGACPRCKGKGVIVTDMAFMDDVVSECEICHGTRYDPGVLSYTYEGKNIVEILGMTVSESYEFFQRERFAQDLYSLIEVGLGYLRLNQSLTTLSGGEQQRLKLAKYLHDENALYLLDEPTDGLHLDDMQNLMGLFARIVDAGNSLIALDHHPEVIKQADWIIEMGPEGGHHGGELVFSGTPEQLVSSDDTITKPYL